MLSSCSVCFARNGTAQPGLGVKIVYRASHTRIGCVTRFRLRSGSLRIGNDHKLPANDIDGKAPLGFSEMAISGSTVGASWDPTTPAARKRQKPP